MNDDKIELLKNIILSTNSPIIIENQYISLLSNPIIIDASSGIENFSDQPSWLTELEANDTSFLVIKNIDYIHKEEQNKLIEILKYRKVGTNKLRKNLLIVLTVDNMDLNNINEEIISLTVQI